MQTRRTEALLLTFAVFLIAIGEARAQTPKTAHARIPFEFWIGSDRLPAGDYLIEQLESTSFLYIRSADAKTGQGVYTLPVGGVPANDEECKLIFRVRNGNHYLYGGWGPSGKRVVTAESAQHVPSGTDRAEVPITFQ